MSKIRSPLTRRQPRFAVSLLPLAAALLHTGMAAAAAIEPEDSTTVAIAEPIKIPGVTVKGQALKATAQTFSATVLDAQQIRDQAVTQPEELLRRVPGVIVRSLSLGGVANSMTIRGFSSGGHGGDLGMVVDGIPLNEAMSHADGYADLNIVVPLEIERFRVFRGPVSALYGNFNRGGVLAIETRTGGEYTDLDVSAGSFGTADVQAAYGGKVADGSLNLAAQYYRTNGFRAGFGQDRGTLAGRYGFKLSDATDLLVSARLHKGDWDNLGNVSRAQFEGSDPYGADPRVVGDGGLKRYYSGRVDVNHRISDQLKLLTFLYGNTQDLTRFFTRPVDATPVWKQREETYDRKVIGGGFSLNGAADLGVPLSYVAGVEFYREQTGYQYYEGTTARRRVNNAVFDRRYALNSLSAFTEMEVSFTPSLRGTLGLRHDRFTGDCTKNGTETGTDLCAKLNNESRTTPKLGLRYDVTTEFALRGSVAEGFSLPSGSVKYAPGGAAVQPTIFRQLEVGANYSAGKLFSADLAVYRIDSRNEVRTISVGVFENFGRTRRKGAEASVTLRPAGDLELSAVYGYTKASVLENRTASLVGKVVTGVPKDSTTLIAAWRPDAGLGGSVETRRVGTWAVLADNSVFYPAYTTVDLAVQYSGTLARNRHWKVYAKVENATDKLYATSTGITAGQQTYNVAPPRGVRVGLQWDL